MYPDIDTNYLAIAIAVVANFFLGFVWYTPLFGKVWAKEMGFSFDEKPAPGIVIRGMIFMVVGNFLMAWVFSHNIAAWDPTTWHRPVPHDMSEGMMATMAALFTWLGFYVPMDLNTVAWEMKSWKLFFINTTYHLLSLLVVAFILVMM